MRFILPVLAVLCLSSCASGQGRSGDQRLEQHLLQHAKAELQAAQSANQMAEAENTQLRERIAELEVYVEELRTDKELVDLLTQLREDIASLVDAKEDLIVERERLSAENQSLADQLDDPQVIQKLTMIFLGALGVGGIVGGKKLLAKREE